jgi:hypothetical protein
MPILRRLLGVGFLPDRLPDPFVSSSLGSALHKAGTNLPTGFINSKQSAELCRYNYARPNSLRRKLGIPNPIPQYNLSLDIEQNWATLANHLAKSKISLSTPTALQGSNYRALQPKVDLNKIQFRRASIYAVSKYVAVADISNFYSSIYTHSIAWALHTKRVSKKKRFSNQLIGNSIDKRVGQTQDGQTLGIPTGPDSSFLIGEIILSAIDAQLPRQLKKHSYRHVDDYEFGCKTYAEAEQSISILQELLTDFELELNPTKTKIVELPIPINEPWVRKLKSFQFGKGKHQRTKLIDYFSVAFESFKDYRSDSVLRYAVSATGSTLFHKSAWDTYQNLLFQCLLAESGTAPFVTEQLLRHQKAGYKIDKVHLSQAIEQLILKYAPLGYSSEVSGAIWLGLVFKLRFSLKAVEALRRMQDSVVAIMTLDAQAKGLISNSFDFPDWRTLMHVDELRGTHWLLAYEANVKGWLPSVGGGDHVSQNSNFRFLKTQGVEFYDSSLSDQIAQSSQQSVSRPPRPLSPISSI